ncbi:MAG: hypothetical protein KTR31_24055 [Myxococcales bacterium]|nr:hypothetical protein [Myxococcales bacterium]
MIPALSVLIACTPPEEPKELVVPVTTPDTHPEATAPAELTALSAGTLADYGNLVVVDWVQDQTATVHLEYRFEGEPWRRTPERALGPGPHQEVLLGIPYQQAVIWKVVADNAFGSRNSGELRASTTDPPFNMPVPQLLEADASRWDEGMDYVLVSVSYDDDFWGPTLVQILDRQGRVVWAHATPRDRITMHARLTNDHTSLLLDYGAHWTRDFGEAELSQVVALKIDGSVDWQLHTPGLYHPFTQLPDGSVAYARHKHTDLDGDHIGEGEALMIASQEGGPRELFHCDRWLPKEGCGTNTVSYDPVRNVFLYSLFTVDTVVEVDATTGEVDNWFGRIAGSFSFDPPSSQFWYQHGGHFTEDGTLLLSTHVEEDDTELVVREYELDEATRTLRQVWSAGVGAGVVGRQMGEAHRLSGGNTLHNYGTHAVLREFAPDGSVVWDVRWEGVEYGSVEGHAIGRSVPIDGDLYAFAPPRL